MTPEQARRAAAQLEMHPYRDPEGLAAALAAVEFLRRFAAVPEVTWRLSGQDLRAADPGGVARWLQRVPAFAAVCPEAWARYGQEVVVSASHAAAKRQRYSLARRLEDRRCPELAQAVIDCKLRTRGDTTMVLYEPDGPAVIVSRT